MPQRNRRLRQPPPVPSSSLPQLLLFSVVNHVKCGVKKERVYSSVSLVTNSLNTRFPTSWNCDFFCLPYTKFVSLSVDIVSLAFTIRGCMEAFQWIPSREASWGTTVIQMIRYILWVVLSPKGRGGGAPFSFPSILLWDAMEPFVLFFPPTRRLKRCGGV